MAEPGQPTTGAARLALSTQSRWRTVRSGVVGSLLIVVSVVGWWGWRSLVEPIGGPAKPVTFKVRSGEGAGSIASRLEAEGFARSHWALLGYLRLTGQQFIEGVYYLKRDGSSLVNIAPIVQGEVAERQVTIPEGFRVHEIAQLLEREGLTSTTDFLAAATYSPSLLELPANYRLKAGTFLEGFLFPDTYRLSADATASQIVKRLMETFLKRTEALALTYEQLILASIVEREAKLDDDRPLIAGVYANRLKLNMLLQADPTVQYGKANAQHSCLGDPTSCATPSADMSEGGAPLRSPLQADEGWWPILTVADYQGVDADSNTYRVKGLPPRPIANPGLASIMAAAKPAQHNYLYFLTDAEGKAHFATTLEEHTRNKVKFLK